MILRVLALLVVFVLASCRTSGAADRMSLSFGAHTATPVMLIAFGLEADAAPMPRPEVVATDADRELPRTTSANLIGAPRDVGRDGLWRVAAQWVELTTNRAYSATLDVPVDALRIEGGVIELQIIFGPNGELVAGSDPAFVPSRDAVVDVAQTCGARTPGNDRDWRGETGRFPQLEFVFKNPRPAIRGAACPDPKS